MTTTKDTFGESLRREREMRGVTLEEIAAATRIAQRFLQAIESEQWDQLPGGVFNRGFVRAVARYLGLDEENIVAEYTLAVGDRQTVPVWTGRPPAVTADTPWLAWILGIILTLAILAGAWYGTKRILAYRAAKRAAQAAAIAAPSAATPDATAPAAPGQAAGDANATTSVPAAPANSATPAETAAPPPAPATPAAATDPLGLKIATSKRTKVMIVADQDVVYDGNMKAGENHFFQANDHFQISAKDTGAVHIELNGKAIPPIGPAGHSGKITLTRDTLKGAPGGAN